MSWEQLLSIREEQRQDDRDAAEATPVACPYDGYPLQTAPDGSLFCVFDGWSWSYGSLK